MDDLQKFRTVIGKVIVHDHEIYCVIAVYLDDSDYDHGVDYCIEYFDLIELYISDTHVRNFREFKHLYKTSK